MIFDNSFYKKILDSSHDEICVSDRNGIIIYCNRAFEFNYGISKYEMIGKHVDYLKNHGYASESPIPESINKKSTVSIRQDTHTGKTLILTAAPVFDKNGNIEYIVENVRDITELNRIKSMLEDSQREVKRYKSEVENFYRTALGYEDNIICEGKVMGSIFSRARQVAKTNVNVMLLGESGTGKSSMAKFIHDSSNRSSGPFITINCTTIPPHLLESELFGYKSGAFTGANPKGKTGLVELADGGTLFLDEIGDIPLSLQAKFLQLSQERTFIPVGSVTPKKVDIRIISATNADLKSKMKEKLFREDLYYRLNVIELKMPPLRDRGENLIGLIKYYLRKYSIEFGMPEKSISEYAIDMLSKYDYPGNIRELQNIIQKLVIISVNETIDIDDVRAVLPRVKIDHESINSETIFEDIDEDNFEDKSLDDIMDEYEKKIIKKYYSKYKSSYKVAEKLGISQSKASRLIRKYLK